MSFFDDLFDPRFVFDSEHKQRMDIEMLRAELSTAGEPNKQTRQTIAQLRDRVDRLELTVKTLMELMYRKGVASQAEISVLMQQIDLLDGVEDGKMSTRVHAEAPTCGHCHRYINPRRRHCVYCHNPVEAPVKVKPQPRMVDCSRCSNAVPERQTYFSSSGVVCESCFDPSEV